MVFNLHWFKHFFFCFPQRKVNASKRKIINKFKCWLTIKMRKGFLFFFVTLIQSSKINLIQFPTAARGYFRQHKYKFASMSSSTCTIIMKIKSEKFKNSSFMIRLSFFHWRPLLMIVVASKRDTFYGTNKIHIITILLAYWQHCVMR